MKLRFTIFALATIAATCALVGCAGPANFSYQNVAVTLTASCFDCNGGIAYSVVTPTTILIPSGTSQGGCIQLLVHATNAPATPTWMLYPTPNLGDPTYPTGATFPVTESGSQVGTVANASGPTNFFCGPTSPPIYSGAALLQAQTIQYTINGVPQTGIPQGDVLVSASVPADPANPSNVVTAYQLFQVYTGVSVHLSPATSSGQINSAVTIPRGTTYQFNGYGVGGAPCATTCVVTLGAAYPAGIAFPPGVTATTNGVTTVTFPAGSTINNVVWEVGPAGGTPVIGGSAAQGFITQSGLYTAPAAPPAVQSVVTLYALSLGTVTANAYVTIQ